MGSYVFRPHAAEKVQVTGTFDNWGKSVELHKEDDGHFVRRLDFESADKKILYKFLVDGTWTTDPTKPVELTESGIQNNVLQPHEIEKRSEPNLSSAVIGGVAPGSSTAEMAGKVPLEKDRGDMPGAFPESSTPANEGMKNGSDDSITAAVAPASSDNNQSYGVSPLPAMPGAKNPITTKPGEPIPDASTVTPHDLQSNVRTDKESYENSGSGIAGGLVAGGVVAGGAAAAADHMSLPPAGKGTIPESSLPMGAGNTVPVEKDQGPMISSTAGTATSTGLLAGQVPLEPRGVPEVVKDSQEDAGAAPEASASPTAVADKSAVEDELKAKVPEEKATSENTGGITGAAYSAAAAGAGALGLGGAAAYVSSKFGYGSDSAAAGTTDSSADVPEVVKESQDKAHADPEASANPEAVAEKSAVEKELKSERPEEKATSENSTGVTGAIYGAAAGGAAAVGGAAVLASEKAGLPESVTEKIKSMNEAAGGPSSTEAAKSATPGTSTVHTSTSTSIPAQPPASILAGGASSTTAGRSAEAEGTTVVPSEPPKLVDENTAPALAAITGGGSESGIERGSGSGSGAPPVSGAAPIESPPSSAASRTLTKPQTDLPILDQPPTPAPGTYTTEIRAPASAAEGTGPPGSAAAAATTEPPAAAGAGAATTTTSSASGLPSTSTTADPSSTTATSTTPAPAVTTGAGEPAAASKSEATTTAGTTDGAAAATAAGAGTTATGGAMAAALASTGGDKSDSRDVSPFSGARKADPSTSGGGSTSASTSTPTKNKGASKTSAPSTPTTTDSKKEKRRSKMSTWFSEHFGSGSKNK